MTRSGVTVFVGTQKGAYAARSDARRRRWKVEGPFQVGMNVYHVAPDPRRPGTVYSLANSSFWGPVLYRSRDGGHRWTEMATPGLERRTARSPNFSGVPPKESVVNLWHIEPGAADHPKQWYLGVDPHRLYRSDDDGKSWVSVPGIEKHPTRDRWAPGGGGACLHTIALDPVHPQRVYVGISAAGTFRSEDGGESWTPRNRGVDVDFLPERHPEVGQCVHHFAIDPHEPKVVYRQDHSGIYLSEDSMDHWEHIGSSLPADFGFAVTTAPALPGGAVFAPLISAGERYMPGHRLQLQWYDRAKGGFRSMVRGTPWTGEYAVHREGLAADALDPAGIYLGTTTGEVVYTPNAGRSWGAIPYRFPSIHSVSVATDGPAA